jgi:serine/threonine-protein kinase
LLAVEETPLKQVGKYQITDLLGQGAMGVVYRALDPQLNRYVAVKLMGQGVASDSQLRDRFLREAQAAGSLQHPNIITIFDFGDTDGHLFIAMEYIEGADLSELMERRDPLPLQGKLDIIIDVLNALAYAHSRGVIHRDIKPANIRVSTDGRAKLMDFGIARLDSSELTKTGMLIGTPHYMAPEQVQSGKVSPATDLFSMGVVLYEFLTYRRAFEGDTLHSVLYKIMSEEPQTLKGVPGIKDSLRMVVEKALAKDPAARYTSANDMAKALYAVRTELSAGAPVTINARRTPLAGSLVTQDTQDQRQSGARPMAWIAAGIASLVALGAIVMMLLGRRPAMMATGPTIDVATPAATQPNAPAAATTPPSPANATSAAPASHPAPAQHPQTSTQPAGQAQHAPVAPAARETVPTPAPQQPSQAPTQSAPVTQAPPQNNPAPASVPAPQPAVTAPAPTPAAPAAAPVDPRPEIEQLVAAYARAIEARNVAEMRRLYPGMTGTQQQGWEQFFRSVRNVQASLAITRYESGNDTAELSVSGGYDYDGSGGRQHQPASFRATVAPEGGAWRFRTIR